MKKFFSFILSLFLLVSFILQGCTAMPNQPYIKKETSEATPLKMIRYETPKLKVYTTGGLVGSIVVGAVLLGVIGAGLTYVIYDAVSTEPANPDINDFGKLVMDGFVERSKKEIPDWPDMVIQEKVAAEDIPIDKTSYILTLKVGNVKINAESGLSVDTIITMKDKEGNIVWEKGYWYDPAFFNRLSTFDALKADKFKKLNEEFAFVADKTVTDFITHFKNSKL
jgi:hypothetical protein